MVPRGRPHIDIGYKYNAWKVLYFIVTDNAGSTQAGFNCLSKYPDHFTNVAIFHVACPLVMYKFFMQLIRFTPQKNQGILICCLRSSGILSLVDYGHVQQLLW